MAWRSILGCSESEVWGQKPYDLGAMLCGASSSSVEEHKHTTMKTNNLAHHDDEEEESDPAGKYAQKHSLDTAAEKELRELVEHASHDAHGSHDSHDSRQCQVLEMPKLRRNWDEPEGHGHADWGSVFVDLVYVGVAYSLGIVLKNAFYSCKPPGYKSSSYGSSDYGSSDYAKACRRGGGDAAACVAAACRRGGEEVAKCAAACRRGGGDAKACDSASSAYYPPPYGGSKYYPPPEHHRMLLAEASDKPYCVEDPAMWIGMFYIFVIFLVLFNQWFNDLLWKARFHATGVVHVLCDCSVYLLLMWAAVTIGDVQVLRMSSMWFYFSLFNTLTGVLWILRYKHVAFFHPKECVRREASSFIMSEWGATALRIAATIVASDNDDTRQMKRAVPLLLLFSGLYSNARMLWRVAVMPQALVETWQDIAAPLDVSFIIGRCNEFIMLMFGETILQIVISNLPPSDAGDNDLYLNPAQARYMISMLASFGIILTILHSHVNTVPSDSSKHAIRRSLPTAAIFYLFYMIKSFMVMSVGIGVKIALYAPEAEGFFSEDQRLQLAFSIAMAFATQYVLHPTHSGLYAYYGPFFNFESAFRSTLFFLRVGTVVASLAVYKIETKPWIFLLIEAALCVGHTCLLHAELYLAPQPAARKECERSVSKVTY